MTLSSPHLLLLSCSLAAVVAAVPAGAGPINQNMPGPTGQQQQGSLNHVGMSRSGRFVLMPDVVNAFGSNFGMYVRDIAAQTTTRLADGGSDPYYAISPSGRYIAYWSAARAGKYVLDRVRTTETLIPANAFENIGLSDSGHVLFIKGSGSASSLVLLNLETQTQQTLYGAGASLGSLYQRNPLSADGRVALFQAGGQYQIRYVDSGLQLPLAPQWSGQNLLPGSAALASSGKYVAFTATAAGAGNYLYRAALSGSSYTVARYDMSALKISVENSSFGGLSTTADGRFISFYGTLETGHPEYAAAQAIGSPGYGRIFRYDTRLNQLVTMTTAFDGSTISGSSGTPLINTTSVISDDGSMVEFATNARNVTATPPTTQGGEQNYHAWLSNGYARNYQFVDLPSTQNQWTAFSPMTLIGDHLWEGHVDVNAASDAFRIAAGGQLVNGTFDSSNTMIGAGPVLGQAVVNGGNISPSSFGPQFSGRWRILFNDQTLSYSYSKPDWKRTVIFIQGQTFSGQDMFIRGGIDHVYAQNQLGLACTTSNYLCAVPVRYRNTLNPYTFNWKTGDGMLDWYGAESGQTLGNSAGPAQGSVPDWTTSNSGYSATVAVQGYGYSPLNTWGDHYWMLDVDVDCSRTVNGWFEVKSFISGGPGWEPNIAQVGTPYVSGNHFAQCGKLNRFQRGNNSALILPLP